MSLLSGEEPLQIFLEEALAHLQTLESSLLSLEDAIGAPIAPGLVDEMFRAAHSIKGGAGLLELGSIQQVTHELENLLALMRAGQLDVTLELAQLFFEAIDLLGTLMVEAQAAPGGSQTDIQGTLARFEAFRTSEDHELPWPDEEGAFLPFALAGNLENLLDARAMAAVRRAMREGHYLYEIALSLEGCRHAGGQIVHPVAEKVFALATVLVLASDPPVPPTTTSEPFAIRGHALAYTSADPMLMAMLVPLEPTAMRLLYDPAAPPPVPLPAPAPIPSLKLPPAVAPLPAAAPGPSQPTSPKIRVDVRRLDALTNLIGELVIENTRLAHQAQSLKRRYGQDAAVLGLNEGLRQTRRLASELQWLAMRTRMVPVEKLFSPFPRQVRELARKLGKEVHCELAGLETEIDRGVSEQLEDPLTHLIRNALDHGLETPDEREAAGKTRHGTLRLSAFQRGNRVIVRIQEDGRGIDRAKVLSRAIAVGLADPALDYTPAQIEQFLFMPGFSTAERITDVSGRGVGMDVVSQSIRKLRGSIVIETEAGAGTAFEIQLPLTMVVTRALLMRLGQEVYAVPIEHVQECQLLTGVPAFHEGQPVASFQGERVPLYNLGDLFAAETRGPAAVVIVSSGHQRVALAVDALEGEQDIVVKSLGAYLAELNGLAGATVLADGRVGLIVDVDGLLRRLERSRVASA